MGTVETLTRLLGKLEHVRRRSPGSPLEALVNAETVKQVKLVTRRVVEVSQDQLFHEERWKTRDWASLENEASL